MENMKLDTQQVVIPKGESGLNAYQKLMAIQTELKAPKNLYNSYGNFKYRNAEGILEALKPLLAKYGATVIMEDIVEINGSSRYRLTEGENSGKVSEKEMPNVYIRAVAHFIDVETGFQIETSALARECDHRNMTADQCTGTASSYARKYCLNALFLLDDTKDSDTDEIKNIEQAGQVETQAKPKSNWNNRPQQQNAQSQVATNNGRTWGQKSVQQGQPIQQNTTSGWKKPPVKYGESSNH